MEKKKDKYVTFLASSEDTQALVEISKHYQGNKSYAMRDMIKRECERLGISYPLESNEKEGK